jgi:hypothetical protein
MNFARDILPLLVAGGGMAAAYKSGIFEDPAQKGNNEVWKNLGQGNNADGSANTNEGFPGSAGAPMQLPGAQLAKNPLAGSAPLPRMSPAFANPNMAYQMPQQMQGGQVPSLLAAGASPQPMMAQMPMLTPMQQPQATAGLLGAPDEKSQADFLKSQLYGMPQPAKPISVAGGSSTPQSNPFLYASLYNNNRQVQ